MLVPAIRRPEFAAAALALIRFTALRFRWVGWFCFGVFVFTGIVNLAVRGIGWQEVQQAVFWRGSFGSTLAIKLTRRRDSGAQWVSRFFFRTSSGCGVGIRSRFGRDTSPETASGKVGPAQSAAGIDRDSPGHHAGARRAIVSIEVNSKHEIRSSKQYQKLKIRCFTQLDPTLV